MPVIGPGALRENVLEFANQRAPHFGYKHKPHNICQNLLRSVGSIIGQFLVGDQLVDILI